MTRARKEQRSSMVMNISQSLQTKYGLLILTSWDMFAGAFLYAITQNYNFRKAGEFASLASAQIVTQFGPRLEPKSITR